MDIGKQQRVITVEPVPIPEPVVEPQPATTEPAPEPAEAPAGRAEQLEVGALVT